ncbi:MAG TPA: hypothetical protein DCG19_11415 [Cryomorphaceae bacterium]|nr:hypothetical protein [Owenweeksia sp.]MBG00629.1 hypothetical protein [Owenweeksia sp.]HAD98006.1 hypothetical protein [Cryomorphaceae bacterium]HBF21084.1 hypothetical protein [Cryomorphaceae bacterium]HCQ15492.1 hypothetical protein [Cryomorphaceae bacterium]|tara:strand:- start:5997 stop:6377 length:381 start_codon:yes stop_codon:yes gene_type:complete
MKVFFGFIIALSATYTLKGQTNIEKFTIDRQLWENCETGQGKCDTVQIVRSPNKRIMLIMPCGGTSTAVTLTRQNEEVPIRQLNIKVNGCPPTFDITDLEDGNYVAYMFSCALGGAVDISLSTRKE